MSDKKRKVDEGNPRFHTVKDALHHLGELATRNETNIADMQQRSHELQQKFNALKQKYDEEVERNTQLQNRLEEARAARTSAEGSIKFEHVVASLRNAQDFLKEARESAARDKEDCQAEITRLRTELIALQQVAVVPNNQTSTSTQPGGNDNHVCPRKAIALFCSAIGEYFEPPLTADSLFKTVWAYFTEEQRKHEQYLSDIRNSLTSMATIGQLGSAPQAASSTPVGDNALTALAVIGGGASGIVLRWPLSDKGKEVWSNAAASAVAVKVLSPSLWMSKSLKVKERVRLVRSRFETLMMNMNKTPGPTIENIRTSAQGMLRDLFPDDAKPSVLHDTTITKHMYHYMAMATREMFLGLLISLQKPAPSNIVHVFGVNMMVGPCLVMEYIKYNLVDYMRWLAANNQVITYRNAAKIITDVVKGMEQLVERVNIQHVDLNAGNVLVDVHENHGVTAKLCDFGMAALVDGSRSSLSLEGYQVCSSRQLQQYPHTLHKIVSGQGDSPKEMFERCWYIAAYMVCVSPNEFSTLNFHSKQPQELQLTLTAGWTTRDRKQYSLILEICRGKTSARNLTEFLNEISGIAHDAGPE